jgi:hypothetical protein
MVGETKTMVAKPENIFWLTRKMASSVKKAVYFVQTIVSPAETTVTVALTIACKVLTL